MATSVKTIFSSHTEFAPGDYVLIALKITSVDPTDKDQPLQGELSSEDWIWFHPNDVWAKIPPPIKRGDKVCGGDPAEYEVIHVEDGQAMLRPWGARPGSNYLVWPVDKLTVVE